MRKQRTGIVLTMLSIPMAFVVGMAGFTYKHVRQAKLAFQLIAAVKAKDIARVKELLDCGADPGARDQQPIDGLDLLPTVLKPQPSRYNENTPAIIIAATQNDAASLRHLLDHGAQIEAADADGVTAFTAAVRKRNWACERLLLERGARMRDESLANLAFNDALDAGQIDLIRVLAKCGRPPDAEDVEWELSHQRDGVAWFLVDQMANVNDRTVAGDSIVMVVTAYGPSRGSIRALARLLQRGANVNLQDYHGNTTLSRAIANNNKPAIALLKKYGAKE